MCTFPTLFQFYTEHAGLALLTPKVFTIKVLHSAVAVANVLAKTVCARSCMDCGVAIIGDYTLAYL